MKKVLGSDAYDFLASFQTYFSLNDEVYHLCLMNVPNIFKMANVFSRVAVHLVLANPSNYLSRREVRSILTAQQSGDFGDYLNKRILVLKNTSTDIRNRYEELKTLQM
jgi:hypothetical protein